MIPEGDVQVTINEVTEVVTLTVLQDTIDNSVSVTVNINETDEYVEVNVAELGLRGLSAYEVWLANGNTGTVNDYLDSLKWPNLTIGDTEPSNPQENDLWIDTNP